jgi:hypothetical protein
MLLNCLLFDSNDAVIVAYSEISILILQFNWTGYYGVSNLWVDWSSYAVRQGRHLPREACRNGNQPTLKFHTL